MKKLLLVVGLIFLASESFGASVEDFNKAYDEWNKTKNRFNGNLTIIHESNENFIEIENTSSPIYRILYGSIFLNDHWEFRATIECEKYPDMSFFANYWPPKSNLTNVRIINDYWAKFYCMPLEETILAEINTAKEAIDDKCPDDQICSTWKIILSNNKLDLAEYRKKKKNSSKIIQDNGEIVSASSGTGFFITNSGYIVTNDHVIDSCNEVKVHYNNTTYKTTLVANDHVNDLALLKTNIKPKDIFTISKEDIGLLEEVYVAGFPFGKDISSSIKVTKGVVSSLTGIGDNYSNVQVDAALQPGNSGGPIIDEKGNVVGVAVAKLDFATIIEMYDSIPENTNFGIKSSVLQIFLKTNSLSLPKPSTEVLKTKDIGSRITNATVYIDCWMTQAKIQELRSRKVMFTNIK